MTFGTELDYPLPLEFIRNIEEDELEFPPFRAVESLAADGHKCFIFTTPDNGEVCLESIRGVTYVIGGWDAWRSVITSHHFDGFLGNTCRDDKSQYHDVIRPRVKRLSVYAHSFFEPHWLPNVFRSFLEANAIGCCSPIQACRFRTLYPHCDVRPIYFGVNLDLCAKFEESRSITHELGILAANKAKGFDHAMELANEFRRRDVTVLPPDQLTGMPKRKFLQRLSTCRWIYYPSVFDAVSRSLVEAAACGCWIIYAEESAASASIAARLTAHPVRLDCRVALPDRFEVLRPIKEIADEMQDMMFSNPFPVPQLDFFDARASIQQFKRLITGNTKS